MIGIGILILGIPLGQLFSFLRGPMGFDLIAENQMAEKKIWKLGVEKFIKNMAKKVIRQINKRPI